jgi:hypothetical protein
MRATPFRRRRPRPARRHTGRQAAPLRGQRNEARANERHPHRCARTGGAAPVHLRLVTGDGVTPETRRPPRRRDPRPRHGPDHRASTPATTAAGPPPASASPTPHRRRRCAPADPDEGPRDEPRAARPEAADTPDASPPLAPPARLRPAPVATRPPDATPRCAARPDRSAGRPSPARSPTDPAPQPTPPPPRQHRDPTAPGVAAHPHDDGPSSLAASATAAPSSPRSSVALQHALPPVASAYAACGTSQSVPTPHHVGNDDSTAHEALRHQRTDAPHSSCGDSSGALASGEPALAARAGSARPAHCHRLPGLLVTAAAVVEMHGGCGFHGCLLGSVPARTSRRVRRSGSAMR